MPDCSVGKMPTGQLGCAQQHIKTQLEVTDCYLKTVPNEQNGEILAKIYPSAVWAKTLLKDPLLVKPPPLPPLWQASAHLSLAWHVLGGGTGLDNCTFSVQ